jgi:translation elongation factor EF-1alpha
VRDERPDERARGVTVDVALARFVTPRHDVTLLDAPGHRDFVPNMISGAALADAALLLVDGSPGGFEAGFSTPQGPAAAAAAALVGAGAGGGGAGAAGGGQTREHAQLARSLGVEQLAVVISKLDTCGYSQVRAACGVLAGAACQCCARHPDLRRMPPDRPATPPRCPRPPAAWLCTRVARTANRQERFTAIQAQLLPFLKSVGFKDSCVQWMPAVGPAGQNLREPPSEPALAAWWRGPTLVQAIDAFVPKPRNTGARA